MVDDMIEDYQARASAQEKETLRQYFALASIHHQKPAHHVVATSLFWKPAHEGGQDYPEPTRELMKNPQNEGLDSLFKNPWEYYVEPIFRTARQLAETRPDLTYRVYLANDLAFLIPELGEAGCEVYLMESSSILHNPGAMWRFLAMEEEGLVTMNDSDRAKWLIYDVERTEGLADGPSFDFKSSGQLNDKLTFSEKRPSLEPSPNRAIRGGNRSAPATPATVLDTETLARNHGSSKALPALKGASQSRRN